MIIVFLWGFCVVVHSQPADSKLTGPVMVGYCDNVLHTYVSVMGAVELSIFFV